MRYNYSIKAVLEAVFPNIQFELRGNTLFLVFLFYHIS